MKKFISMVMAAAMVVSLVPATAFAATGEVRADRAAFVVDKGDYAEDFTDGVTGVEGFTTYANAPEVHIEIKDSHAHSTSATIKQKITFTLDNAEWACGNGHTLEECAAPGGDGWTAKAIMEALFVDKTAGGLTVTYTDGDEDWAEFEVSGTSTQWDASKLVLDLCTIMDNTGKGDVAKVSVESDIEGLDRADMVYAEVKAEGIKATLKKVAEVALEERTQLERDLVIEPNVGKFKAGQEFELKLTSGFEFATFNDLAVEADGATGRLALATSETNYKVDDNIVKFKLTAGTDVAKITIPKAAIVVDAADSKADAVCSIKVKAIDTAAGFMAGTATVEAVKVLGDTVTMSVDEDKDVPVIYSGVNVANDGINDDSNHMSLEVTIKESVKEAWDTKKAFTLTLPEGVYATNITEKTDKNTNWATSMTGEFKKAYEKGEYECFEFARHAQTTDSAKPMEFSFELELIAVPGFEGDVTLTLDGAAFDKAQEVTIAKFVAPYTIEAAQNDLIIDYRNTAVPTNIVVKEAEAGLWDDSTSANKALDFTFGIEKFVNADFEDDAVYTVDDKSELEVKAHKNGLGFKVTEESDDEAAVVTISNISLYMSRSLAAGAYDLSLGTNAGDKMMTSDSLLTNENSAVAGIDGGKYKVADVADWATLATGVNGFAPEKDTVKEGFINVITAGRDQDDASFTKKVVVPVGEAYLVAGEETVTLDVPAYINAAGYTMLPVRAVATALGINNNNVLWDQATKTVTILYGQRIITMQAGQKVIYVNGSAIPAYSAVEIKDGRTFVVLRDLATALGVTDVSWDPTTKTATLNGGNQK